MNDYSDLIFLMGAMILFSLLTMNVSRSMVNNTQKITQSHIEYNGISLAHSIIEQAQWAPKDSLDPNQPSKYMFDGYSKNNPQKETLQLGSSNQYQIDYYIYVDVQNNYSVPTSSTNNKKITVGVTSPHLHEEFDSTFTNYPITMDFIAAYKN